MTLPKVTTLTTRQVEEGLKPAAEGFSYAAYLKLEQVLSAQSPLSQHHDEMMFIIQHQTSELWMKLLSHELNSAMAHIAADDLKPAQKRLARVKQVQKQLTDQWSILATLTPSEYDQFRRVLGSASGFQSAQYRRLELLLGNKNAAVVELFASDEDSYASLRDALQRPSLYDEFVLFLGRRGFPVPVELLTRDWRVPHELDAGLVAVVAGIYERPESDWDVYQLCEDLVDLEDGFQTWRFRHLKTVERIIGVKAGTGGSTGVSFLRKALSMTFFPELFAVRTEMGR